MRDAVAWRVVRKAWLLLVVLAAPLAAGCFEDEQPGAPLARPTDQPIQVPQSPSPARPATTYNFSDPGYAMTGPWRAGDGWDYESNQSHFRQVRVIDSRLVSGTQYYVVEERAGDVGQPPKHVTTRWIDGKEWMLINATDDTGAIDHYTPGLPLRSFKNGSFVYNHSRVEGSGRVSVDETVLVQTRLQGPHQTVLFPWGYVEARRVEETQTARDKSGERTQEKTIRWVQRDYLNDVQYQLPDGELYKLTAAKTADFRRGTLATW